MAIFETENPSREYEFTARRHQADDQIVLLCEELPISGVGGTVNEAVMNLLKAFFTYTEGIEQLGQPFPLQPKVNLAPLPPSPESVFSWRMNYAEMASR